LPLKHTRAEFIGDINKIVSKLDDGKKAEFFEATEMVPTFDEEGNFTSYEGIPTPKNLDGPARKEFEAAFNKFHLKMNL
jgi:hypothetical protein